MAEVVCVLIEKKSKMQETEEDFEEEFILDANEIQEELEVGGQEEEGEGIPEEEEEERDMELDEDEGYDGQEEQQQFDFKDDSIQGFFDHKGRSSPGMWLSNSDTRTGVCGCYSSDKYDDCCIWWKR